MTALVCETIEKSSSQNDATTQRETLAPTKRLRVLHVVNGEHYAGAERVQDLLAQRLPQQGVDVAFFCVKPDRFPTERASQQTPLWSVPMKGRFDLRPALKLMRLIREQQIDVLHTHSARGALIAGLASWWTGVPMVHHVHGQTSVEVGRRFWTRLNAWLERRVLRSCNAVVAVSQSVADYLKTFGAPTEKTTVIANGVSPSNVLLKKYPKNKIPTLGFVALLRPRKGLEVFLDAGAELIRTGRACKLNVVGRFETPEYEREILTRCESLGIAEHVTWRGFSKQVDKELNAMDVLVFPSILAEGMPMVLLEAMAAGVPIVASRVAGVTDVITDGHNGLLVEPNQSVPLAASIRRVLDSPELWQTLSDNSVAVHAEKFSDHVMAANWAKLYRQVLGK
jgi:glycosyltransferase involved in cell wall biosynthesis